MKRGNSLEVCLKKPWSTDRYAACGDDSVRQYSLRLGTFKNQKWMSIPPFAPGGDKHGSLTFPVGLGKFSGPCRAEWGLTGRPPALEPPALVPHTLSGFWLRTTLS